MIEGHPPQVVENEWIEFPGGELEGIRPNALCPACRERLKAAAARQPLCFQCYRAELNRERGLVAAGHLNTASEERFQTALPFEPINVARLEHLRADRATARAALVAGAGRFVDKRRRAQIAARHALQQIAAGLQARNESGTAITPESGRSRAFEAAARAAELQLPESWLAFVVGR